MAFRFRSGKYSAVKNPVFTLNDVACSVVFSLKNKQENISGDSIKEEPPTKPVRMRAIICVASFFYQNCQYVLKNLASQLAHNIVSTFI